MSAAASRARGVATALGIVALGTVLAACSGGLLLANQPLVIPAPPAPTAPPSRPADPVPIELPRDDGPHDRLTEWWYYTGHLATADGRHFGFEAVIFRAERGDVPVTWASHLALTDESGNRFLYAQRSEIGPQVDRSPRDAGGQPTGFDLAITGSAAQGTAGAPSTPWVLSGSGGADAIHAATAASESARGAFGLDLAVSPLKRPALHDDIGWVPFGPAGGSYYYSRTRMTANGTLTLDGTPLQVQGQAWFDHQWGDFISVGGGGWDWFAVNLANGTDLTLSLVRAADGTYPLVYGTLDNADGSFVHLDSSAFGVTATGTWTSPNTGATYPAGWRIEVPGRAIVIELTPTVADQELDTRPSTGVVYWEGSQRVAATVQGAPVGGQAYVELTGYGTAK
ncbi:MAG TPA: lipocalin family protein [Candidatus Limnocylindrales bacterium]